MVLSTEARLLVETAPHITDVAFLILGAAIAATITVRVVIGVLRRRRRLVREAFAPVVKSVAVQSEFYGWKPVESITPPAQDHSRDSSETYTPPDRSL